MQKTLEYINSNKDRFLEELKEVLRIPSISAQTEHNADTRTAAEWFRSNLQNIGMKNSQLFETKGHPIVYAEWLNAPNKPTILIYGHYDVQSTDPLDQWESKPFEPEIRNGNIYARGTADDKGQLFTHIKAIESIMSSNGKLPVNIKFLIEGEEEMGGPNLETFIQQNTQLLQADVVVISDNHSLSTTQPMITYGLKGIVYMQIDLSTMPKDTHSGIYGGNIPNAAVELANLIAQLKDQNTQKVLIPGFYDGIRALNEKELGELEKSPFNEKAIIDETGVKTVLGVEGFNVAHRAGAQPTLDTNGMCGGYTGEGAKTIIPAKASAKISMRTVPNQTSGDITTKFSNFIHQITPDYVDIKITNLHGGEPIVMNITSDYFTKAEAAFEEVFGTKPLYELSGGSIPVTAVLKKALGIDSVLMGFGLPDDGLHSPNEKMSLEMFYKGIETSARFISKFDS